MAEKKLRVARDPVPLARTLVFLLWIYLGTEVLWALASVMEFQALAAFGPKDPLTYWDELPTTGVQSLVIAAGGLLSALGFVVSGILTLKWIYRVNLNAVVLAPAKEVSPAWSVGWFFVPFASVYMPFKAMRETWQISQTPDGWRTVPVPPLLRWWWALFLITNVLDNGGFRMSFKAETAGMLALSAQVSVISAMLTIPLILVLTSIVRQVTDAQAGLLEAASSASG